MAEGLPALVSDLNSGPNYIVTGNNQNQPVRGHGALKIYNNIYKGGLGHGNGWSYTSFFEFDASQSDGRYGNSENITPLSLKTKWFIKY